MRGWIAFAAPAVVFLLGTLVAQEPGGALTVAGPLGPPAVVNAPYSAEMISTFDKVLPSGKRVHGETHGKAFRDSQGRTRKDADAVGASDMEPKGVFVLIIDPVEHRNIELDSRTMIAHVYPWRVATKRPAASGARRPRASAEGADSTVASSFASPATPAAPVSDVTGAAPTKISEGGAAMKTSTSEDLGTREMEGLTVSGIRWAFTAGALAGGDGQAHAGVEKTVVEWEARDMRIVVLKETDDAKTGHFATRLVHIVRTEPDATLFQIPAGYTVTDDGPQKKEED